MESRFIKCSCGKIQPQHKMQSVNNELVCKNCAKNRRAKRKKQDDYQAIVILLDGTRLYYQPMGG